ncbi:MAG: glycogen synthase GlgA [Gammaproteobacteria bacterium]|nr:glycogen synthase GlgA [Gammaproteobacteria bacterium]
MRRILFVTSEAHPLIKTGGLGDVCGSLPQALLKLGEDVRILLPGYRFAMTRVRHLKTVVEFRVPAVADPVRLCETRLPGTSVKAWLIDAPAFYDRPGSPYTDTNHQPWHDNDVRFALFARVAAMVAQGITALQWRPDIVHCHDWQSGLTPALLSSLSPRPATVFTIHNLAYQGVFGYDSFAALQLPSALWSYTALEYHGQLSFIKGGIAFADRVTTVSPTYANEIQTPDFGHGLDGLLRHRAADLRGILNGIDPREWNPARDNALAAPYTQRKFIVGKRANKAALQAELGLPLRPDIPLMGMVSRLVEQKGVDLLLQALPGLLKQPLQVVVLGTGQAYFEQALSSMAKHYPTQVAVVIGYDEALAHRIIAGIDMFVMPSRFEPCGLTQLYSLRYGTVPVVRRVGGLADTVTDATEETLADGRADGVAFDGETGDALQAAVQRATALYHQQAVWHQLCLQGMRQDFSWRHSALEYQRLYDELVPRTGENL